jgi:hypothetical protein
MRLESSSRPISGARMSLRWVSQWASGKFIVAGCSISRGLVLGTSLRVGTRVDGIDASIAS